MASICSEDEQGVILIASQGALDAFSDNVSSLWAPSTIPIIEPLHHLSALEFCRDFVGRSRPCILRDTTASTSSSQRHVPPLPRWSVDDIQRLCGDDLEITVNVTPDGHGDAIRTIVARKCCDDDSFKDSDIEETKHEQVFLLPEERRMRMSSFDPEGLPTLHGISRTTPAGEKIVILDQASQTSTANGDNSVFYYSLQNDCLRSECSALVTPLQASAGPLLLWAEQAFGTGPPDAVNIWIGDERAHSSLHKDPYENLFYVASGEKIFTLYPPSDAAFLPVVSMPTRRLVSRRSEHREEDTCCEWHVVEEYQSDDNDNGIDNRGVKTTPWINPSQGSTSEYRHPMTVRVQAGDILYLPSLWFHAVSQSQETVAINWWFDMQFQSPLYCYFQLLESCKLHARHMRRDADTKSSRYGVRENAIKPVTS
ncbi:cupin-like domain-containing protein [Fragilaria crotonensis]|nr:cupin-like domain-containing protein [Fragilaria crotonensis]